MSRSRWLEREFRERLNPDCNSAALPGDLPPDDQLGSFPEKAPVVRARVQGLLAEAL
ncbi:hypothetical protein [Deinococcus radiotolerans]|uniref:Uncharacterized protein n=1 Tax=Deinococcus radiotolerans TaxID=1309407 RepID=A0ABQ2FM44_9DEIO|nr:hypothetical protein [Deinococcus radiotolerans]GGL08473.1 hypothetical protein GCM10010844_29060 [Deinococcus radiotolerans]